MIKDANRGGFVQRWREDQGDDSKTVFDKSIDPARRHDLEAVRQRRDVWMRARQPEEGIAADAPPGLRNWWTRFKRWLARRGGERKENAV